MKVKIFIYIILSSFLVFAQNESDTTYFQFGQTKVLIIKDTTYKHEKKEHKFSGHFSSLSLGLNSFTSKQLDNNFPKEALELDKPRSWEVNIDVLQFSFNLIKQHFGIVTGLGFKFNNYRFKNNYTIYNDNNNIYAVEDTIYNYTKSKMTISSVRIPLLFEWQNTFSRKKRSIYIGAGLIGSYKMQSFMKYNYTANDDKKKLKKFSDYYLNPFQYSIILRFGIGEIELYGEYNLSSMFEKGKAIDANQFSAGIILLEL